uniref:Uncharacterized protein n=1 Tax=uncultured prokaryote TaxID=198431 RepID=A0A0H5Q8P9_9ZZZZ|nr:hypothetical protein [uncultured prokaryote]
MATVYVEDTYEFAVQGRLSGKPCINVFHVRIDGQPLIDDLAEAKNDFLTSWQDFVMDEVTSNYTLEGLKVSYLGTGTGTSALFAPLSGKRAAGSITQPACAPNTAVLINKISESRGRGRRDGRVFLGGVPEQDTFDNGTISSTAQQAYQNAFDDLYDRVTAGVLIPSFEIEFVIPESTPASRTPGPQSVTIPARKVSGFSVQALMATQRARLR